MSPQRRHHAGWGRLCDPDRPPESSRSQYRRHRGRRGPLERTQTFSGHFTNSNCDTDNDGVRPFGAVRETRETTSSTIGSSAPTRRTHPSRIGPRDLVRRDGVADSYSFDHSLTRPTLATLTVRSPGVPPMRTLRYEVLFPVFFSYRFFFGLVLILM